ncbi:amidase [Colletotrichum incanum]|nr:amidase [Colletotrichum incanum]
MDHLNHYILSASEASFQIKAGTMTMVDYEARHQQVKAWATIEPDSLLRQAREMDGIPAEKRGPPHGFAIAVKAAIYTKGDFNIFAFFFDPRSSCLPGMLDLPTRHSSPIHAADGPLHDASCVAVLRRNGHLIMGKTTATEFTATFEGLSTRSPHDPSRSLGGSSSGSAAAVADFTVRPASYTGVYVFKPTWNAMSTEGQKLTSLTFDTFAVMSTSVEDLQRLAEVCALSDVEPPLPRVGTCKDWSFATVKTSQWPKAGPATVQAMLRAAQILAQAVAHVVKLTLPVKFDDALHFQNQILKNEISTALYHEY